MSDLGPMWVRDYDAEHNRITYDLGGEVQRLARKVTQMVDAGAAELVIEHLEEHGLLAAHDERVRAEERERIAAAIEASDLDSVERFTASDGYPSLAVLGGTEIRAKAAHIARQGGSDGGM